MTATSLEREIVLKVQSLAYTQQQQVLAFIHGLLQRPQGVVGRDLLTFAGSIDQAELHKMQVAITQDCENIDHHEW